MLLYKCFFTFLVGMVGAKIKQELQLNLLTSPYVLRTEWLLALMWHDFLTFTCIRNPTDAHGVNGQRIIIFSSSCISAFESIQHRKENKNIFLAFWGTNMLEVLYRDLASFGLNVGFSNFKIITIFISSVCFNFFLNFLLLVANTNSTMQSGTNDAG